MTTSDVTMAIAIVACGAGLVVTAGLWRQRRRAARARRLRHPATPPPVVVTLDRVDGSRRWRIDVRPDVPPTAIDIVSWRPRSGRAEWTAEPIVAPIEIHPGGWALTPSEVPEADRYDVSIAWTVHSDAGELTGSRTFSVTAASTPTAPTASGTGASPLRRPIAEPAIAILLVAALAWVVVNRATDVDDSDAGSDADASSATADGPATTGEPITTPATQPSPSTLVPITPPSSVPAPGTTPASTTVPATTAPTTVAPSTVPTGPSIDIVASIGTCSAGPDCLVAGFSIDGFDAAPTSYVCEFADGDRITFGFGGESVERACATGSADAGITIEIDGVRSDTVTRADVS